MAGELARMLADLVEVLGGELNEAGGAHDASRALQQAAA
jgi:recombination associated protein RdgC